jgi:hypothetical protein
VQQLNSMTEYDAQQGSSASDPPPRENAVLVFGSTGKLGRQVVLQVTLLPGTKFCQTYPLWNISCSLVWHPAGTYAEGFYMLVQSLVMQII